MTDAQSKREAVASTLEMVAKSIREGRMGAFDLRFDGQLVQFSMPQTDSEQARKPSRRAA